PLGAELEPPRFTEDEVLQQGKIGAVLRRSADQAAACVAVDPARYPVRRYKCGCIEKRLIKGVAARMVDLDVITTSPRRELGVLASRSSVQRHVVAHGDGER